MGEEEDGPPRSQGWSAVSRCSCFSSVRPAASSVIALQCEEDEQIGRGDMAAAAAACSSRERERQGVRERGKRGEKGEGAGAQGEGGIWRMVREAVAGGGASGDGPAGRAASSC
ncbi:uncharacterized protein LOC119312301 [Triticum dicoccoides]|uniref:uncharacterized protein LOC119312301 n=1 Tax=Triticum dicoccoides TaxID=85692 RepID=UPI001890CE04|nr:uncharacterized protein LOC119312301 [Triticum dicoccoides]XP_044391040.1 uncharacterized protein LOC123113792 isoform X1 [Triticum aestivum]